MPAAKRSAPSQESAGMRRRSGRLSNTQLKSVYFESSNEDESEDQVSSRKKRATQTKKRGRKAASESDAEEQFEEEAEVQPKKKSRGRPAKKTKEQSDEDQYHTPNEDEDDKDNGDDDDDDDDDDGPRKVEIIPLEKLRDTGGVPYEDHYVHKNTMLFLKDLKANNKRSWLKCEQTNYHRPLILSPLLIGYSMQHTMESTEGL